MRRIILIIFVCFLFLNFSGCKKNYTHGIYEVSITAYQLSNDSVGNSWRKVYNCDGREINSGERWTIPLNIERNLIIDVTITENDKWPDIGRSALSVVLKDGFKTSEIITVIENKGRYKGNKAQWKIICEVELIEKIEK